MRRSLILILSMLLMSITVPAMTANYGKGVSRELADHRKATIKELGYSLHFDIPRERQTAIKGRMVATFSIESRQEVVFDFKNGGDEGVESVAVNGRKTAFTYRDEHIVVPKESLRSGQNKVEIAFIAGDQSLNRNDDYLYTLLVPERSRTLFPCFDQPNMKASFSLSLDIPSEWMAVANASVAKQVDGNGRKQLTFNPTHPISTYLFSFVVGNFQTATRQKDGRQMTAYYRETDEKKVAQLDTIFSQVASSIRWQEHYTGIKFPFEKYDFVILPGFQYGGMEHPGATLYNDRRMFLSENPTPDEELARMQLIAHEVSHIWFGDLVTMNWFDDVWTKEVFANYYAARITQPLFPNINHQLNWLKTYVAYAQSTDRTNGTNAIHQTLDNLQDAGLVYGNIVYDKAPVVMKNIAEIMGDELFRDGMRTYLKKYSYGNATWDDLIAILDSLTPTDLKTYSKVWVDEKGMPRITLKADGDNLVVDQHDPFGRAMTWQQSFDVMVCGSEKDTVMTLNIADSTTRVALPFAATRIVPNIDGRGYGLMEVDKDNMRWILSHWQNVDDDTQRQSLLMLLNENFYAKNVSARDFVSSLLTGLAKERNALIASSIVDCLPMPLRELDKLQKSDADRSLFAVSRSHAVPSCRKQMLRMIAREMTDESVVDSILQIWRNQSADNLDESSYTEIAYELAIRLPQQANEIISTQRGRINNPDRLRQFDFISRAAVGDTVLLDSLFASLLKAENRRIEPWTVSVLSYLNHTTRDEYSVKYIRQALDCLAEVQRTGDIFMPTNWVSALLSHHRCRQAYEQVVSFLKDNPDYPQLLKNKILQSAYPLYRTWADM